MVKVKERPKAKVKAKAKPARVKPAVQAKLADESIVVSMLVDESGSMMSVWEPTISGFNEYVDTLKSKLNGNRCYFSAIKFDTAGVRKLQVGAPIKDAVRLDRNNYTPNGGTPLLDAVANVLLATDEVVKKECGTKVIVVIQTDGQENSSVQYDLKQIRAMVEERQGKGWQILFLGAGINAFADGTRMGVAPANTMSYGKTIAGTHATFAASASNTAGFGSGALRSTNFNFAQSAASGEDSIITASKLGAQKVDPAAGSASVVPPVTSTPIANMSLTG